MDVVAGNVRRAFPAHLARDVDVAAAALRPGPLNHVERFGVSIVGEPVEIPYRIYHLPPDRRSRENLTHRQRLILDCLLTRHHNGFVRQAALSDVIRSGEPWAVPYVVELIGEYVVEIVIAISEELVPGDPRLPRFRRFADENQDFVELTRRRAVSYWDCYYRARWPSFAEYPATAVIDRIRTRSG